MKKIFFFCVLLLAAGGRVHALSSSVRAGGLQVHYTVTGKGDAFVFCHAGYQDSYMWVAQQVYFSKFYKVVLIDMPGHGQTKGIDSTLLVADVIRIVLDSLHIPKAIVAGLSMGASCATDFALDYPERVSALIAISPGLSGWPLVISMDSLSRQLFARMDSIRMKGDHAAFAEGFMSVWCIGPYRKPAQVDVYAREYVYETTLRNRTPDNGWPVYDTNYAARRIKNISCPVLVIRGDKDIPFIIQVTDYYQQQLPRATLVKMPNVAHMLNMEKPDEFNRLISNWLSNLP